jgi:hypothetical protein
LWDEGQILSIVNDACFCFIPCLDIEESEEHRQFLFSNVLREHIVVFQEFSDLRVVNCVSLLVDLIEITDHLSCETCISIFREEVLPKLMILFHACLDGLYISLLLLIELKQLNLRFRNSILLALSFLSNSAIIINKGLPGVPRY